jgi:hypothetical protein
MTQPSLPFSGRSPVARACSLRAAREAATYRAEKTLRVLAMLRQAQARGLTRHDLATLTGYQISSLCSIVDALVHAGLVAEQGARISGPYARHCTIYCAAEGGTGAAA